MDNKKKIGIYMDHSSAHIMEFKADPIETLSVASDFTHETKEEAIKKSESLMHHKEQQEQNSFYKQLGTTILKYDEVLLFGPTEAKNELHNLLSNDHHFEHIKIEVQNSDKLTENQQHAIVRQHFAGK